MSDLLERMVAAVEKIADNMGGREDFGPSDEKISRTIDLINDGAKVLPPDEVDYEGITAVAPYAELAKEGKREALLVLCADNGLTVPPRTRTDTLVKMLEEADKAELTPKATEAIDPFADNTAPPLPPLTIAQVREALTKIHADKGVPRVVEILQKFGGGVSALKDLQPVFFKAVYDEAAKK